MTGRDNRSSLASWLRELRRAAAWHRRLLVAGLIAAAVTFAIQAATPEPPRGVAVLIAAKDLAAGTPLAGTDVRLHELPPSAVPDGSLRSGADVDGRTLAGPVRTGEVITDVRLVGRSYLEAYDDALVAVPVRIADAASVRLLHAGDVIDVLAAGAGQDGSTAGAAARLVASAVQVVTIPRSDSSLLGSADVGEGALLVVATTSATAESLAGAAVSERLSVVLRPD